MSCPCKKIDDMRQCDFCTVTGAKIGGVLICDVDYDYCPDYVKTKQKKPRNMRSLTKRSKQ